MRGQFPYTRSKNPKEKGVVFMEGFWIFQRGRWEEGYGFLSSKVPKKSEGSSGAVLDKLGVLPFL